MSAHVIVVSLAIVYIYFSTVFVFLNQWFGLRSSPGIINAVVFTALALMCVCNYALAMLTDPGRVPPSFAPDIEDSHHPIHEIKRKDMGRCEGVLWILILLMLIIICSATLVGVTSVAICENCFLNYLRKNIVADLIYQGGDLRYCKKCCLYKPPRSHHCRICKRCVLRMDHHCVWMNNCVGHANYKIFFVFVVYALLACVYSLILLLGSLTVDTRQSEGSYRSVYIISGLLLIPLSMALGVFLGWHVYLTLQNKTTIEYYEGVRAMLVAEQGGNVYSHPYDLGVYENLITVLGPNIFCWVCPLSSYIGSGLRFRTAYDHHAATTTTS